MSIYNRIRNVNRRIQNIKNNEVQPWTLKSEANIFGLILRPKGSSKEGEILTYKEADFYYRKNNNGTPLPPSTYYEAVEDFLDNYANKVTVNYAYEQAKEVGLKRITSLLNSGRSFDELDLDNVDDIIEKFDVLINMKAKDFVKFMQELGETLNNLPKGYSSDQALIEFVDQYIPYFE